MPTLLPSSSARNVNNLQSQLWDSHSHSPCLTHSTKDQPPPPFWAISPLAAHGKTDSRRSSGGWGGVKKHPPRRAKLTVRPAHRLLSPPFLFVSSSSSSSSPCSEPFPVRNRSKRAGGVANRGCLLHGRPKTAREGGSGARTIDRPPTDRRRRRDSCEERSTRKQRGFAPDPSEGRSREGECWDDRHLNIASSPCNCCCRRIVSPDRPKMPFQIPNSHSSGRGWCVTQDQPDDGSTRAKNTVHLSDTHTHTQPSANRQENRRVRGAEQPRPQEATTHRQTHTHTPHGKSAKKRVSPNPTRWEPGGAPRPDASFVIRV